MNSSVPVVYLMRGLPGCGKSHKARRLAEHGGLVLETDRYFYTEVGDDPSAYSFDAKLLPVAREWIFGQFKKAIADRFTPIVLDRGNGRNPETREFASYAVEHGYSVRLAEPDSDWWQELRVLLKYKQYVASEVFDHWAKHLADRTRDEHRVPTETIRHWMLSWRQDLTVDDILDLDTES